MGDRAKEREKTVSERVRVSPYITMTTGFWVMKSLGLGLVPISP